jgi:GNAT superfamily N-acetyltransferase
MAGKFEIITVDQINVEQLGFYCYRSKKKSEGYRHKLSWLTARFAEGLRIRLAHLEGRPIGFIEYAPGNAAWRPVHASNYMVIHCLYRRAALRGEGYGAKLLETCIEDARTANLDGVVAIAGKETWLPDRTLFDRAGFEAVDETPPTFELLLKRFNQAPLPTFPDNWDERLKQFGAGLTVIYTGQCPYNTGIAQQVVDTGREFGLEVKAIELKTSQEVRELAPSPFGTFHVVYDGKLLLHSPTDQKTLVELFKTL